MVPASGNPDLIIISVPSVHGDDELDPIPVTQREVPDLILVPELDLLLGVIGSPVLDAPVQRLILVVLAGQFVQGLQDLSLDDRGPDIHEDDGSFGQDGDLAGHLLLVSGLDGELHVVSQLGCARLLLHLGEVEIDLANHVSTLDVAGILLDGVDHPMILNGSGWIFKPKINKQENNYEFRRGSVK